MPSFERDWNKHDDLHDFERRELTFLGQTRLVYVMGTGPAVIVMSEMPDICLAWDSVAQRPDEVAQSSIPISSNAFREREFLLTKRTAWRSFQRVHVDEARREHATNTSRTVRVDSFVSAV
jgi:hypothetical protein